MDFAKLVSGVKFYKEMEDVVHDPNMTVMEKLVYAWQQNSGQFLRETPQELLNLFYTYFTKNATRRYRSIMIDTDGIEKPWRELVATTADINVAIDYFSYISLSKDYIRRVYSLNGKKELSVDEVRDMGEQEYIIYQPYNKKLEKEYYCTSISVGQEIYLMEINVREDEVTIRCDKISVILPLSKTLYVGLYTSLFKKDLGQGWSIYCDKLNVIHIVSSDEVFKIHRNEYMRLLNILGRKVSALRSSDEPIEETLTCEEFLRNHYNKGYSKVLVDINGFVRYVTPKLLSKLLRNNGGVLDSVLTNEQVVMVTKGNTFVGEKYKISKAQDKTIREIRMRGVL